MVRKGTDHVAVVAFLSDFMLNSHELVQKHPSPPIILVLMLNGLRRFFTLFLTRVVQTSCESDTGSNEASSTAARFMSFVENQKLCMMFYL